MAKKNKPADAAAKPAKASASKSPRSLFQLGLPYLALSLFILLAVQATLAYWLMQGAERQRAALAQGLVKHYQAVINEFIEHRQHIIDGLPLADDALLLAVAAGEGPALAASLQAQAAGAQQLLLTPVLFDPAQTALSFAQQDMVVRAAQSAKALPPEIAMIGKEQVLTYARPLRAHGVTEGMVLVSFPLKPLSQALTRYAPEAGRLELGQGFGADKSTAIISAGEPSALPFLTESTRNPNWELRFAPALTLGADSLPVPLGLLLGLLGGSVVLVGLLGFLGFKGQDKYLDDDVSAIDGFNENFLRYGQRVRPALHLRHFGAMLSHLEQYGSELLAGKRVPAKSASEQQRDEIAGILLSEGDEGGGLLGAAAAKPKPAAAPSAKLASKPVLAAEIFRAYDIRGRAGSALSAEVVRLLGLAIGSEAQARGEQTVIVGRDARLSSPELIKALIDGLQASGRDVIDVGTVPTPVLYFATKTLGVNSGVMLTGSHNPAEDNGLKIVLAGHTLAGAEIQALKTRVEQQDFTSGMGGCTQQSVSAAYIEQVASDVVLAKPVKVVVDGGNGVAGNIGVRVLEALGCEVVPLFCEPDGNFPNHHPDPARPENLEDLAAAVAANEASLGVAFDGDGDRLGVVTPAGKVIYTDRLMMLLAKHVLASNPGADIIFDVKCSRDLVNLITGQGGRPVMNRTGHSYLKAKLAETGAPLAGEMSGHIIFNDRWYGFDDAIYAAARVLEILSLEALDADAVFAEFPEAFSSPELNVAVDEDVKEPIVFMFAKKAQFKDATVNTLDGVRVDFADGWGLVRASNTTASLSLRFEGRDEAAFRRIQGQFRDLLLSIEPGLKLPF